MKREKIIDRGNTWIESQKHYAELKKRPSGKDRNLRKEIRKVVAKGWG